MKGCAEVRYQACFGVCTENPENTIESIQAAAEQGYGSVYVEINVTADGQFVLLSDRTLNRLARNCDGSELSRTVYISDITYGQAIAYDFGIGFSRKFKGARIAFLWDVLEFAVRSGLKVVIGFGDFLPSDGERKRLFGLLEGYQSVSCLVCKTLSELESAAKALPQISLCYFGDMGEGSLENISRLVPKSRLSLRLDFKDATKELCERVKKYAELEIGLVSDYGELACAESFGADVVLTKGQIKPPVKEEVTADMHTHSEHSHDCAVSLFDMREAQSRKCTDFVAVTNHADIEFFSTFDSYGNIKRAEEEVLALNARNDSFSRLLVGAEIGDGIHRPELMRYVEQLCDYDVIIGSIHSTMKGGELVAYSRRDFSLDSDEEVDEFMTSYLNDLKLLVEIGDFDILAHLTCPLRYVVGKYGKSVDMSKYDEVITDILKSIIKKGIALELNTSSVSLALGGFIPDRDILVKYKALGGYLITLGSDAHIVSEVSANFDRAKDHLKSMGFKDIYYFKKRRAYPCRLV